MPSSPDALSFVLANTSSIPHFRPGEQARLEMTATWGDVVLDVQHLAPGEVARVALPEGPTVEVARCEGGTWILDPARVPGFADLGKERCDLHSLRGSVPLQEGDRAVLLHGDFAWVLRPVPQGHRVARAAPSGSDLRFGAMLLTAAVVGVLTTVLVQLTPPPVDSRTREETLREYVSVLQAPPPPPVRSAGSAPAAGDGARSADRAPQQSSRSSGPETAGVFSVVGGELDALLGDSGLAAARAASEGIQGLIGGSGSPFGHGTLAGRRGGVPGGAGTCEGDCGVGPGRHGPGSGYDGDLTDGPKAEGRIDAPNVIVVGPIDKAEIDRVIKQNLNAIRYCYQRELVKDPELGGRVVVKFTIAGDGSVTSATTKASTLGNAAAESCINGRFQRMRFPALKGGGIAIVSYPFIFSAD